MLDGTLAHSPYLAGTCLDIAARIRSLMAESERQRQWGRIVQAWRLSNQATRLRIILEAQTRVADCRS